jgi:hypothetical protein
MKVLLGVGVVLSIIALDGCQKNSERGSPASSTKESRPRLFSVVVDGKYGFIDLSGRLVITPQFDDFNNAILGDSWAEGLAAVCVGRCKGTVDKPADGKWGYIDASGKFVINPRFDFARSFSEGLAAVQVGSNKSDWFSYNPDEKWGFIDTTGEYVAEPQFSSVSSFKEGLAVACIGNCIGYDGDGKEGYIDKTGKFAINPQFDSAFDFDHGLALVQNPKAHAIADSPKQGYIDKTGKYVWNPSR